MHLCIHKLSKIFLVGLIFSIVGFLTYVVTSLALGDETIDNWESTTPLNTARRYFVTVYGNGHLYALGGADSAENALSNVEMASINSDGSISDWHSTTPLSTTRRNFAAVQANGYIYVLGGYDGSQSLSSVERAQILTDGSLGSWETMSELTLGRSGLVAVVFEENIYVVGGSYITGIVESASINPDGTLSSWQTTSSLNTPRAFLAAVVAGEYLYAIGGQNSGSSSLSSVERVHINSDGSLGTWQTVTSMQNPRCSLEAIVVDSYIYALNGSTYTIPGVATYDNTERALIHTDNSLGPWESTVSLNTARRNFAIVKVAERYLYALGGENNPLDQPSSTLNSVERTTILWKLYLPIIEK